MKRWGVIWEGTMSGCGSRVVILSGLTRKQTERLAARMSARPENWHGRYYVRIGDVAQKYRYADAKIMEANTK